MAKFAAFVCGLIFGFGLIIAQMSNPAKVLNFLDIAGHWDPSLAFVMGGAVIVTFLGYRLVGRAPVSLTGRPFEAPRTSPIDARLVSGAALFGIGWGLVGLCPGPAIVALGVDGWEAVLFIAAMAIGMVLYDRVLRPILPSESPDPRGVAAVSRPR